MKNNLEKVKMENKEIDASFHPIIKDDICCYRSSSKVINLAKVQHVHITGSLKIKML